MAVSSDDFKAVMGSFASGVTVVTTVDDAGALWGLTVSAFCSLSLDPPLCLVCIDERAGSLAAMTEARKLAVNVLGDGQEELSNRFASRVEDKFAGVDYQVGPVTGCPVFPEALAWLECEVDAILDGGDHKIFVGRLVNTQVNEGKPLLYWGGAYGDITSRPKRW